VGCGDWEGIETPPNQPPSLGRPLTVSEFEVTAATVSSIRVKHYTCSHHYIIVITLLVCFTNCAQFTAWAKNNPSA
jgi:hypothetical protein